MTATSIEIRIAELASKLEGIISFPVFSEACFNLKMSEFNALGDAIDICVEMCNMGALEAVIEGLTNKA